MAPLSLFGRFGRCSIEPYVAGVRVCVRAPKLSAARTYAARVMLRFTLIVMCLNTNSHFSSVCVVRQKMKNPSEVSSCTCHTTSNRLSGVGFGGLARTVKTTTRHQQRRVRFIRLIFYIFNTHTPAWQLHANNLSSRQPPHWRACGSSSSSSGHHRTRPQQRVPAFLYGPFLNF